MNLLRYGRFARLALLLSGAIFIVGCGGHPDHILINDTPGTIVALQTFAKRGATGRYAGALRSIKASHPLIISPNTVAQVLGGIRIGILPSDRVPDATGIKPTPLFSAAEVAGLAPAIATALKQADPDQYVTFQVGTAADTTDGTLYVAGPVIRLTLSHYHSAARQRDESLAIYKLSFTPETVQAPAVGSADWMESESQKPSLAIDYAKLETQSASDGMMQAPLLDHPNATGSEPQTPSEMQNMKATMEKQAQELESLKTELESLRKQLSEPPATQKTSPKSPSPSR